MQNYGDESDSGVLLYPSIYSNHGIYEHDFFRPHPPEKIREIFKHIGVEMSDEAFEELWARAAEKDPRGRGEVRSCACIHYAVTVLLLQVCVETFRMVAEEVKVQQYRQHKKDKN